MKTALNGARAYLAKLPPAISGAGGHNATFRAACWVVRLGLDDTEGLAVLNEWNGTHCHPPWKERELLHKLADARRKVGCRAHTPTPRQSVRVVWKIERKTPKPATPIHPFVAKPVTSEPIVEGLPYVTSAGDLVIPFNSPVRFHWWKPGGMTPSETRRFCLS